MSAANSPQRRVVLAYARHLAEDTAGGQNLVARRQFTDQFSVRFLAFLLRPDQQEVKRDEDNDHRQEKTEGIGLRCILA